MSVSDVGAGEAPVTRLIKTNGRHRMKPLPGKFLPVLATGLLTMTGAANAALESRAGGQAYYDTDLNITWLADTNLAAANSFGVPGICRDNADRCGGPGTMTWSVAQSWLAAMNTASYLGVGSWRLPTVTDTGVPGCSEIAFGGTDCGYNVDLATGEMAHLYYGTLGNIGGWDTSGVEQPCETAAPNHCLMNKGPFSNLHGLFWSGTEYAPSPTNVWWFGFGDGFQWVNLKDVTTYYAWAVSPGDLLPVPIPPAAFLFPSALAALTAMRRKFPRPGHSSIGDSRARRDLRRKITPPRN